MVLGVTVTLLITGALFSVVTDALLLAVAPLASVAVTVQAMVSPGLLFEVLKVKLELVPMVLLPFVHA